MPYLTLSALVENKTTLENLTIYPNPVSKEISINTGDINAVQVSIYDIQGKLLI